MLSERWQGGVFKRDWFPADVPGLWGFSVPLLGQLIGLGLDVTSLQRCAHSQNSDDISPGNSSGSWTRALTSWEKYQYCCTAKTCLWFCWGPRSSLMFHMKKMAAYTRDLLEQNGRNILEATLARKLSNKEHLLQFRRHVCVSSLPICY